MTHQNEAKVATRRSGQKAATKQKIMAAALDLCARQGFLATRTIDVARAAGVAHGSIFVHFPSREALLAALVQQETAAMLWAIHDRVESGAGVAEVLRQHLAGLAGQEAIYGWLVREQSALPQAVGDAVAAINSTLSWHLSQALAKEQAKGTVRRLPESFVFNCWIGLVHHYLANRAQFAPKGSVIAGRGEELVEGFMNMLAT